VAHELSYIEQSRRDFAAIDVPVTWLQGEYDAWVDLERVRDSNLIAILQALKGNNWGAGKTLAQYEHQLLEAANDPA